VRNEGEPEVKLARRLLGGDETALEEFLVLFQRKVFQYSLMMCGDRDDAEDVAQDTLMKVFEHLHQLQEPERVKAWVFRIARNACYTKRRRSVFAPERELSLDELMPSWKQEDGVRKMEIADWSALPEDQVLAGELNEQLRHAILAIPEIYRSVLLLRDVENLTTAETAAILGVSEEVVKTRLHRARLAVRKQLDAYMRLERPAAA
jgi:RNA polymerase sigma-70 factor (ECF subfamily)